MDQLSYVRKKLTEANKRRGALVRIAREIQIDVRTVRAVLDDNHLSHDATLGKLETHFRKSNRGTK